MQFIYVLISVILLAGAIWLVSKRLRLSGSKSSVSTAMGSTEKSVDSLSQNDYFKSANDNVELGPVRSATEKSIDDSGQMTDRYAKLYEKTVGDITEIETHLTEKVEEGEEIRYDEPVVSRAEDSKDEDVRADDAQTESDQFGDQGNELQVTDEIPSETEQDDDIYIEPELEPLAEVVTVEESADIEDEDIDLSQAETHLGNTVDDREGVDSHLPIIEDPAPNFGEYSKKQIETKFDQNGVSEKAQQTMLKLPELSDVLQPEVAEVAEPIQAELEVSVAFPDYRESGDREIDVVGWLPAESNVIKRMDVLTIYKNLEFQLDQPHEIIGFDIDSGQWNNLETADVITRYSDLIFTLQLSHKGQPVSEKSWWKFTRMVEHVANALSRNFHFSMTTDTVITEARLLNSQIRDLDLQAILLLKSDHEDRFSKKGIEYLAREYDLQERPGTTVFDRYDGSSNSFPLFSVVPMNDANILLAEELGQDPDMRTMIIFSNLACVPNPRLAFDTMFDVAKDLEDRLAVKLIDQNHKRVNLHSISRIRSKIDEFSELMSHYRITPGGEVAMRLFDSSLMVRNWAESQGVVSLKPVK